MRTVFASTDPFAARFQEGIDARLILYPTDGYILNSNQFNALQTAAAKVHGETRALLTIAEPHLVKPQCSDVWRVSLQSFSMYKHLHNIAPISLENCHFSMNGLWGISISQEFHAVVGGSSEFINELQGQLQPDPSRQLEEFLNCWEQNQQRIDSSTKWIAPLLKNLYGEAQAKAFLLSHPTLSQ